MRVLITGSRAPVAILLARSLHAAGAVVYTADSLRPNFGQNSRTVTEDFCVPSPRFASHDCLATLARLARDKQLDAIIPTCEETFALAAGRTALPPSVRLLCPDIAILDQLHHKGRGIAFAASLGIATPETCAQPDVTRDGILKRAYSRFSSHVIPLRGTQEQRQKAADKKPTDDGGDGEWVWQEWILGKALCTYSLCHNGQVLAHAAYRTPYTVGLGAGIFYDAVHGPMYDASLAAAQKLAAETHYTGSLSLDFIEEATGRLVLIEINPRATMGLALLSHQPAFAVCWKTLLGGDKAPEKVVPGTGRRQLKAAMLLLGRKRSWRDVFTTPDVLSDPNDPGPARAALCIYLSYAWQAKKKKLSTLAFSTHDIEWNG
ncbi:hypothetical protein [Armatimonas sp.]|uniref:hypothetical protein n=1 Tax=Armatimonas sp. TaxID=1872638 RepID=UPI003751154A